MTDLIKEIIIIVETKWWKIYKVGIRIFLCMVFLYGLYLIWAVLAFGGGCRNMQPEIHYIPEGYIGNIYILFDDKIGVKKEKYEGKRIYRIPKTGILRTQFRENLGWVDEDNDLLFYYTKKGGDTISRILMLSTVIYSGMPIDSTQIVVIGYGYGSGREYLDGKRKTILSYKVDSLKNWEKRDYILTKEMYDSWDK